MAGFDGLYCTDEDLLVEAGSGLALAVDNDQRYAQVPNGTLAGFRLTSAGLDPAAAGVVPGMACRIAKGATVAGDTLIVAATEPGALTLRRKGSPAGQGAPPRPGGAAPGVQAEVYSALPQIRRATAELNDEFFPDGSSPVDPAEFRRACVLKTLIKLYGSATVKDDIWARRRADARDELAEVLAGLRRKYPIVADDPDTPLPEGGYGAVARMVVDPNWRLPTVPE